LRKFTRIFKKRGKMKKQVPENHPLVQKKIEKSLNISIKEGSLASVVNGLGASYLTPYAIALNASSSQIGILNALTNLLPSLIQLKASKLPEKFSRKKIVILSVLFQALMFIPIILAGFLFMFNFISTAWIIIALITLFYSLGAIAGPAWFSWMGSLVKKDERGRYFAKRNRITGFFGLITMVAGGFALQYFKTAGIVLIGFSILFFISMIVRLISLAFFAKQYEPKLKVHKRDYFTFFQFLKKAKQTPFGRFAWFTTIMKIAVNIGSPFFAVYLLSDLNLGYGWFMGIAVSGALFQILFYPILGKFSDRFGNIKLLKISSVAIAIIPILYLVSKNPYFLITIPEILNGFGWAGFNLATNNYVYDAVRQEKRSFGITYFNLLNGIGLFIGAGIGSLIALANVPFMNILLFIFLISGIARLAVAFFFSDYLKEVRHVKRFSYQFIYKEIRPVQGFVREIHNLNNLRYKFMHFV